MRTAAYIAGFVLLTGLAWYATTIPRLPTGFSARYYAGSDQTNRPTVATLDDRISAAIVRRNWPLAGEPFNVRWDASLVVSRTARYRFSVLSDGSSRLYFDDHLAIDNGGPHGPRQITGEIALENGVHTLRLEYESGGDPFGVDLLWASSPWTSLSPMTGVTISPANLSSSEARSRRLVALARTCIVVAWTIGYLALLVMFVIGPALRLLIRHHLPGGLPAPAIALLIAVAAVYAVAIGWGIPGQGWAPDELIPPDFLDALDRHFSHGWWSKYPPAHFYLSAIVSAPLLVWRSLDAAAFGASPAPEVLWIIFRAISVAMGVGAVLMVYVCGSYLYGSWPSFVAAAISALTLPAMFYAKTANLDVPYLFWFTVSLASFVRILADDSRLDYVLFAITATLAVCTKDQAYGLYGVPVLALACLVYARACGNSPFQKLSEMFRQRHLWLSVALAAATFALIHNLLFNRSGFMAHVDYITGKGATPFRMFDAGIGGQWQLLRAVWMLTQVSWGWPAFVLCLAGLLLALWRPGVTHARLWWLLLPIASYHLTFHAVVGFTYDRFLLPLFAGLALAGGFLASRLDLAPPSLRPWLRASITAALVYTLVYVLVVDVAMLRDPRYAVEDWIHSNVEPGATFGRIGPIEHVPRIDDFYTVLVSPTAEGIRAAGLNYLVVNADWVERFGPGRPEFEGYRELREGRLGYRAVFEVRTPISFAGMSLDRRFEPFGAIGFSTLTKLNPPTVVFKRESVR